MHRHNQSGSWMQLPLAFNSNASPEGMSALRAAYCQLKLSRHMTFEEVMSDRALEIGIRHVAEAIARRQAPATPAKGAPVITENAKGADAMFGPRLEIDPCGTDERDG